MKKLCFINTLKETYLKKYILRRLMSYPKSNLGQNEPHSDPDFLLLFLFGYLIYQKI